MTTTYQNKKNGLVSKPFFSTTFRVDTESTWLKYSVDFTKKGWYSIFIWDSNNQLRSQLLYINKPKEVIISASPEETSLASVRGSIPGGQWTLEILTATYKSESEFTFEYSYGERSITPEGTNTNNWATLAEAGFTLENYDFHKLYNPAANWYKGDFHTHTNQSDGKMTPSEGLAQAKKMNLDYLVATDHNIVPTKWESDSTIMIIPGIEITSSKGHFNALGLSKWVDWRPTCPDGGMETEEGINRVIKDARDAGAVISINHPMLKPWEWQFTETKLSQIDVIEIWNDPTYKDNPLATERALNLWDSLWNDGYRIYGIGGSDSHLLPNESYEKGGSPSLIGDPATFVKLKELSPASLLEGIRDGKAYVTRGPLLDFYLEIDDHYCEFNNIDLSNYSSTKESILFSFIITYKNVPLGATLNWIVNGLVMETKPLYEGGTITKDFSWDRAEVNWGRFEIRDSTGNLLAFNNPFYQGSKAPSLKTWGELIDSTNFKR
jgi:hypothetical protein